MNKYYMDHFNLKYNNVPQYLASNLIPTILFPHINNKLSNVFISIIKYLSLLMKHINNVF